jgi:hypothetical protein
MTAIIERSPELSEPLTSELPVTEAVEPSQFEHTFAELDPDFVPPSPDLEPLTLDRDAFADLLSDAGERMSAAVRERGAEDETGTDRLKRIGKNALGAGEVTAGIAGAVVYLGAEAAIDGIKTAKQKISAFGQKAKANVVKRLEDRRNRKATARMDAMHTKGHAMNEKYDKELDARYAANAEVDVEVDEAHAANNKEDDKTFDTMRETLKSAETEERDAIREALKRKYAGRIRREERRAAIKAGAKEKIGPVWEKVKSGSKRLGRAALQVKRISKGALGGAAGAITGSVVGAAKGAASGAVRGYKAGAK